MASPGLRHITTENRRHMTRWYEKIVNVEDSADSWMNSSTSNCDERGELPGEDLQNWRTHGFRTVFDFLTRKRPNPANDLRVERNIRYNKEVTRINYSAAQTNQGQITVQCADGHTYRANHVIVTASVGVLKADHSSMFRPTLPSWKVNSINAIQFGTLDKIAIEFSRPFWPSSWSGFSLIWSDRGMTDITGQRFEWTRGIAGIWRVSHQPNILVAFMVGPDARRMERLADAEILEGIVFVLNRFVGGLMPVTRPNRVVPSRWDSNKYFRGSYSSRSIVTDQRNAWAADLALPLNNTRGVPIVMFAGEDTHSTFYSTVHGAIETGYREADRIINART